MLRSANPQRRKRIRMIAVLSCMVLVAGALAVRRFSWWSPPVYVPATGLLSHERKIDTSIHDRRVTLLDDGPYILHVEPATNTKDGGALLFFGSRHSKDPNHPQQALLQHAWNQFHPTVALVEGRMSFFVGTATQGIRVFGEGAAVYSLAERDGIPLYTLEPPVEMEIAALDQVGDRAQVALFRTLSGYISARRGGPVSDFKIKRLLAKRAAPLTDRLPDIPALDAYFTAQLPQLGNWRELPEESMWPGRSDTFLNTMATRSNEVRDEHFLQTMLELARRGERVFAIAGRSHTIVLEPALWESMQPAVRGPLSSRRPWEASSGEPSAP